MEDESKVNLIERISELEAERENNYGRAYGRGYNAGCNDSKAILEKALAERDQLAASMETHNVARQKAEQRELAVCAELDEVRASLETARKALEAVDGLVTCYSVTMEQAYFRFITTGQGDVIELVRQALAQIATLEERPAEERDRAADAGYVDVREFGLEEA